MPAPQWWWRFAYDRESAAWARRRSGPDQRALVEATVDELAAVVAPPGPVADLGCGPGAHAVALARRGYEVVALDGSPGMVEQARAVAAREGVDLRAAVHDVRSPLPFADGELGGAMAILLLQHLPHPEVLLAEVRRAVRPGGSLLLTVPAADAPPPAGRYWRLRAACYQRVPGVVRFLAADALTALAAGAGLTVVDRRSEPGRTTLLARA